jgi:hypothetical protein
LFDEINGSGRALVFNNPYLYVDSYGMFYSYHGGSCVLVLLIFCGLWMMGWRGGFPVMWRR